MSLRITPQSSHPHSTTANHGAPSAPGVHDTLRANLALATPAPKASASSSAHSATPASTHPLESRLSAWRQTQENLQMQLLRRQFGVAEPVRRQMELQIVRSGEWRPAVLGDGSARVHADILSGRDAQIDWEDVFKTPQQTGEGSGAMAEGLMFHAEMERRAGMGDL